jgi:hypothetical protein
MRLAWARWTELRPTGRSPKSTSAKSRSMVAALRAELEFIADTQIFEGMDPLTFRNTAHVRDSDAR